MTDLSSECSALKLCLSKPSSSFKLCQWKYAWNFFTITQARSANKMPLGTQCAIEALVFCQQRAPYSLKTQPDWLVWTALLYVRVWDFICASPVLQKLPEVTGPAWSVYITVLCDFWNRNRLTFAFAYKNCSLATHDFMFAEFIWLVKKKKKYTEKWPVFSSIRKMKWCSQFQKTLKHTIIFLHDFILFILFYTIMFHSPDTSK